MDRVAVFNAAVRTLEESVSRAKAAERLGFESVWTTQMPDARDAALVLAAYAQNTERVSLGTGVLPIYTRHPTAMAQNGRYFTARAVYSAPRRPDLPIMISALNPRMLDLAGELADGVVLYMCTPAFVRDHVVPAVRAGREKAGKTLDGFEIVAAVPVSLTTDRAAGHDVFRKTVARYAALPYYRKMMDASGLGAELEAQPIGERVLDELAGIGDAARVRDVIVRYRDAGVTLPGVGPFGGHDGARGFEATLEAVAAG